MSKINNYIFLLSLWVLIVAFFKRNDFTDQLQPLAQLAQEPQQNQTPLSEFSTTYYEDEFLIKPKYDYELFGLVVSYRLHDSEHGQMLHALSKDHINVADYCVVWGDSANSELLKEFEFSNGQFTCNYSTHSAQAWQAFNHNQLSNNHLLAADEYIRETIDEIKIGDQIHIKGQLAHYIGPNGFERGTSVTRTDTGDGACETIWVEEINILAKMNSVWRELIWLSLGLLILTGYIHFKVPFQSK